jgi:ribosomal protein S17E
MAFHESYNIQILDSYYYSNVLSQNLRNTIAGGYIHNVTAVLMYPETHAPAFTWLIHWINH